jgi:hypothetical protein
MNENKKVPLLFALAYGFYFGLQYGKDYCKECKKCLDEKN